MRRFDHARPHALAATRVWRDALGWQAYLEAARHSAREMEVLTFRIENGGRDWSAGGAKVRSTGAKSPTEGAAMARLTVVPQLEEQRARHERVVGDALAAIGAVRDWLGPAEAEILEMFYVDGRLTWEIAAELGITVDGVFYRKRKALAWMDEHLSLPR